MTEQQRAKIDDIIPDESYCVRASIDEETVAEYAEAMSEGAVFPPIELYDVGGKIVIVDGWHRYMAAVKCGFVDIQATTRKGTPDEALSSALGCNHKHGLKLSSADKRKYVEIAITQWPDLSLRKVADRCGVSHQFVADIRNESKPPKIKASPSSGIDRTPRGGDPDREDAEKDDAESADSDRADSRAAEEAKDRAKEDGHTVTAILEDAARLARELESLAHAITPKHAAAIRQIVERFLAIVQK